MAASFTESSVLTRGHSTTQLTEYFEVAGTLATLKSRIDDLDERYHEGLAAREFLRDRGEKDNISDAQFMEDHVSRRDAIRRLYTSTMKKVEQLRTQCINDGIYPNEARWRDNTYADQISASVPLVGHLPWSTAFRLPHALDLPPEEDHLRRLTGSDDHGVHYDVSLGPAHLVTDSDLIDLCVEACMRVHGTSGDAEDFDGSFRKPEDPREFGLGKVIEALWPDLGDMTDDTASEITKEARLGQPIYSKIRRFVIVKDSQHFCSAVPIVTHNDRGASLPGLKKSNYAALYTGSDPPDTDPLELTDPGEDSLRNPIRVLLDDSDKRLNRFSRINLACVYTIEHDVKIRPLGEIHWSFLPDLLSEFKAVWRRKNGKTPSNGPKGPFCPPQLESSREGIWYHVGEEPGDFDRLHGDGSIPLYERQLERTSARLPLSNRLAAQRPVHSRECSVLEDSRNAQSIIRHHQMTPDATASVLSHRSRPSWSSSIPLSRSPAKLSPISSLVSNVSSVLLPNGGETLTFNRYSSPTESAGIDSSNLLNAQSQSDAQTNDAQQDPFPIPNNEEGASNAGGKMHHVCDEENKVRVSFQSEPKQRITDPELYRKGVIAYRLLCQTPGAYETTAPAFRLRTKPRRFFVVGKVFLICWVEPPPDTWESGVSSPTQTTKVVIAKNSLGGLIHSKVRRFVVIKSSEDYCTALPVLTYGGQGVGKRNINKAEHAIIYTGKEPPKPLKTELPIPGEAGMRDPIRVDPDTRSDKLDTFSRLDFAKPHTIDHNLKVKSFGQVNRDSMQKLEYQFKLVWADIFKNSSSRVLSTTRTRTTIDTSSSRAFVKDLEASSRGAGRGRPSEIRKGE